MVGEGWHDAFVARAADVWSPAAVQQLTNGKQFLVTPDRAPCVLRSLGLLDQHARLAPTKVRKFRQVNHLLGFLRPALEEFPDDVTLIDAGCGRSVLGVLTVWWLAANGRRVRLLGIDRNPDVLRGCRERAAMAGQQELVRFAEADLSTVDPSHAWEQSFGDRPALDGVLALHACDTATDDALVLALRSKARFFAVAPCCQVELSRRWKNVDAPSLAPVFKNPHFRRTTAATVTDAMRVELMRSRGYDVRAVEFVEAHHTPKNTLLYGHLRGPATDRTAYDGLCAAFGGAGIGLAERI